MTKIDTDAPKQFTGDTPLPSNGSYYFAVRRMSGKGIAVGVVDSRHSQADNSSAENGCWCYFGNSKAMIDCQKVTGLREWHNG